MERHLRNLLQTGTFDNVSKERSKHMAAVKGRGNRTTELAFRMHLVRARIKGWKMHPKAVIGHPDFYFPVKRIAIFVDGCFWHGCPRCGHLPKTNHNFWSAKIARNRQRDARQGSVLARDGIQALRIWEHELKKDSPNFVNRLKLLLRAGEPSSAS